jgi:hypothetical protein
MFSTFPRPSKSSDLMMVGTGNTRTSAVGSCQVDLLSVAPEPAKPEIQQLQIEK